MTCSASSLYFSLFPFLAPSPLLSLPPSLPPSFPPLSLSLSDSLEVILRAEAVEMVQAGDKCDFTGTLIVVPDVSQLRMEGELLVPS